MADSKIDKLSKDKTELQAQVKVLEQQVKSLKMENEVLKDKVKDVDAKIDIAVAAATGKVREAFEKEVQAAFERGQKFMLETIQTATIIPARSMGMDSETGTLEEGKQADIAILDQNPLLDISNIRTVSAVMADGYYYESEPLFRAADFLPRRD